jgi:hypothetical protein
MSDNKRRLPIVQPRDDDGEEPRPPWHWVVIGLVAILLAWIPLAFLSKAAIKAVMDTLLPDDPKAAMEAFAAYSPYQKLGMRLMVLLGPVVPLAVGGTLGGMLVGRFGAAAGAREATAAGAGAAIVMTLLEATTRLGKNMVELLMVASMMVVLAGLAARAGAALGKRMARR